MNAVPKIRLAPSAETPFPDTACDVTIAICTYNRAATLPRTLHALRTLRGAHSLEVIVVNGPSNDGTSDILSATPGLTVLHNPDVNLAISRNIAIANARGRFIAFLDDDAVPEPDWLSNALARFSADPSLAALGGFIRDHDGIGFQARYVFADCLGRTMACDNPDYITFACQDRRLYPSLTGTNVIFRTDDLRAIGGFDEIYAYFLDETDVNKRMADLGMRAEIAPEVEIHHKFAPSHLRTARRIPTDMYPIARSVAYFAMRHGPAELGWQAAVDRLRDFYAAEYGWKHDLLLGGQITPAQHQNLLHQTSRGIIDGINAAFHTDATAQATRLTRHIRPLAAPPPLRHMRAPDDTLRLCLFSQDHADPARGGIGAWTDLVARGLAERGHEVTVIGQIQQKDRRETVDFTEGGYWSHQLSPDTPSLRPEADCLGLPPVLAKAAWRRLEEFRRINPRRQFQVASTPIWDVEAAALLATNEVPTVLSLHTCAGLMLASKPEWRSNEEYYTNHVLRVINAEIQALRRAPMILANSAAILRDIDDLYRIGLQDRPHRIIPHGIEDIDDPHLLPEAREAARDGDPSRPIRILFLGRIETRKGIKDLVTVIDRLLARNLPLWLDIVGSRVDPQNWSLVEDLFRRHPDHVALHGFLAPDRLDPLMRQADILFCPSLYESFGLIYAEAMRYSLPSVAYATGGVPEVVQDGVDGLLAPPGNQAALETALLRLVTDPQLRQSMSRAARRSFETRFHTRLMAERLESFYRDVARSGKGACA